MNKMQADKKTKSCDEEYGLLSQESPGVREVSLLLLGLWEYRHILPTYWALTLDAKTLPSPKKTPWLGLWGGLNAVPQWRISVGPPNISEQSQPGAKGLGNF